MTNTHINVGGHKITTNKVGQVHNVILSSTYNNDVIRWCVTNGICHIFAGRFDYPSGTQQTVATGLPTPKLGAIGRIGNTGDYVYMNGGSLMLNAFGASTWQIFSITYPVADDWVES